MSHLHESVTYWWILYSSIKFIQRTEVKWGYLPSQASEPLIFSSSRALVLNQQTVQGRKPMHDVKNAMTLWWLIDNDSKVCHYSDQYSSMKLTIKNESFPGEIAPVFFASIAVVAQGATCDKQHRVGFRQAKIPFVQIFESSSSAIS